MEFLLPSPTTILSFTFTLLLVMYFYLQNNNKAMRRIAPQAAGAWPLIGHIGLLAGPQPSHFVLGALADKYGPIFSIRLGVHRAVVVSSSELARECFTTNDKAFSNRPNSIAVEHMGYSHAMLAFSPYGPYWRLVRKITIIELLSNHRHATVDQVLKSELNASTREIYELWAKNKSCTVEMKRWFGDMTLNLIVRIVAGKRCSDGKWGKARKALREFFELMGLVTVADALPWLRWLDFGGHERAMKRTAEELDVMLQEWLEEHKRRRDSGIGNDEQDFMDVMLNTVEGTGDANRDCNVFDEDTIIKATCLNLILGGTESTTITLTWAIALLLNNRHVLKKAQDELSIHIGGDRQVKESDMKNLLYIQAIVKETLRLYPPAQLLPARQTTEDCHVGGYHVPASMWLFVNLWKIHHDPRRWPDPFEFRPERFLTTDKDVDMRGNHFEFIPFGSGRRVCPGITFSLQVVQLTLASFLQGFEVEIPQDHGPIDMTVSFGFTNVKARPLEVIVTPRLPVELYG